MRALKDTIVAILTIGAILLIMFGFYLAYHR